MDSGENHEYLPIDGLASFNKATINLLLGFDHPAVKEVVTHTYLNLLVQ